MDFQFILTESETNLLNLIDEIDETLSDTVAIALENRYVSGYLTAINNVNKTIEEVVSNKNTD